MVGMKSFQATLQETISLGDSKWEYTVPDLPSPSKTNFENLVKSVSFLSSLTKQGVYLRIVTAPSNRITRSEPLNLFLLLAVADFRLRQTVESEDGQVHLAPARDSSDYIARLLKSGIVLNNVHYYFFGHSNSQLKSRSCFMFAKSKAEITVKIDSLGDFSKMKSVGKKAKRLGLLFSSAEIAAELNPERCEDIDDITSNDYIYTDGCGLISGQFARQIVQRANIVYRNKKYLPSVFQIRYRGYKGVLTLSPALKGKTQVMFRESMKKLKDVKDYSFSVVEYSKPYTFGYLNDEIVLLLHSLGISATVILRKQAEYLQFLYDASRGNGKTAFQFLSFQNELSLAEKLLMDGPDAVGGQLRRLVKQEYAKMLNKRNEQRCRIMIPQSRLLFGVCDPSARNGVAGKLRPGTCFVRITLDGDGEARTVINTEVLVTRNPCLHPGDLQKFAAVDVPEFSHLVDCIVFPTCGNRPSADLMSGGDLDGDKFFVTWDPDLVPQRVAEPATYPGAKERIEFGKITDDDRAEFFAKYNNMSLGRVKNLYLKWVRLKGPLNPECQQLNRLFSQCVDGNRIKVPACLEDPPETSNDAPPFILDILHEAATIAISDVVDKSLSFTGYPVDVLDLLSCRDSIAISEFELIQLVLRRCEKGDCNFGDYASLFNYSALSDEQQAWLLSRLPASKNLPSLIKNGLLQSELVEPTELHKFQLHHPNLHWKPIFTSSTDHMARFLTRTSRAMEIFHKKLIVLQADERLTLMIYIPQKVSKATEIQVDASVRVFALPRSSGYHSVNYRVTPTKASYRLYCDDAAFQLYQGKRGNTFIYLNRSADVNSSYTNTKSEGDRRRERQKKLEDGTSFECRASVALDKISSPIQKHVGRINRAGIRAAEIYAISNRDVQSMRYLDQWLHYIDTEEVLPLFESTLQEYHVPSLDDIDRGTIPPTVAKVVWDQDLSKLQTMTNPDEVAQVLQLLSQTGQNTRLRMVYTELLSSGADNHCALDNLALLRVLLKFLPMASFLTQTFLDSKLWKSCRDLLVDDMTDACPVILKELILATHHLRAFVKQPFRSLLLELKQISTSQMTELIELIALSVEEPEFALDLLFECIQPETFRLLMERPSEIDMVFNSLSGIALDHIDEANSQQKFVESTVSLQSDGVSDGYTLVKASLRIDLPQEPFKPGDHIRFVASLPPQNAPFQQAYIMDALVVSSGQGSAKFRCIHPPPSYLAECTWKYRHCGSFVTSKVMFDAATTFYTGKEATCGVYSQLVGHPQEHGEQRENKTKQAVLHQSLNVSQNKALTTAMQNPLVLLWGPPGTGKTQTTIVILQYLLREFDKSRFLVTAPTHNAVDNLLQRFLDEGGSKALASTPLRVSTSLGKVSSSLRPYTCDAMVGKDLSESYAGRREAQNRVKKSRLIFTTCIGSALGLLREEEFDIVLVDEASQQTEPAAITPLTKGCKRAILVGDHVQLRATVQKHAVVSGFDISLFERLYTMTNAPNVEKVMLDTQYRMHSDICSFSSTEFYHGRLQTAVANESRSITPSLFPWPSTGARKVFVQCASTEDIGSRSKSNKGQVLLCQSICQLLSRAPPQVDAVASSSSSHAMDIAILTPYTRQRELLKAALSSYTVSSIDGYQGREADVVIFVTVRSNAHYEIGFLKDLRRLNVAMTRAKAGVIIIGERKTLTEQVHNDTDKESKDVWKRLLDQCTGVRIPGHEH